jgi:hypothetical protein
MYWNIWLLAGCLALACAAGASAQGNVPTPKVGAFVTRAEIASARERVKGEAWAKTRFERVVKNADAWAARDDGWIRDMMPPPGSTFAYGSAGCPACGKAWKRFGGDTARFDRPLVLECPHCHTVFDLKNPKPPYDDTGDGVVVNGQRYFLRGIWNAFVTNSMWPVFEADNGGIINLAEAYAITGDPRYAHKIAVMTDALATLSPTTNGPRDFVADQTVEQGRMHQLTSIMFRADVILANALDMVGNAPDFAEPSVTNPGRTVWDNVRHGLFEEYLFVPTDTRNGRLTTLHNHEADSVRALLVTGLLFGNPDYVRWGAQSFQAFLDNTIDRDGLYYETSLSYTGFTRGVFLDMAEMLARYDPSVWPASANMPKPQDLPYRGNYFNHPRLARLTLETPERVSVLGREPTYGNNHWDTLVWKKPGRPIPAVELDQAERFLIYTTDPAIRKIAARRVGEMVAAGVQSPSPWALFHAPSAQEIARLAPAVQPEAEDDASDLMGQTGVSILRSGQGADRRAVVMRTGPNMPHAHNDQAGLLFFNQGRALSGDIGYAIYGNHVHMGWATQAIAHNLVVVNQDESRGTVLFRYNSGGTVERFQSAPGVSWVEASMADTLSPKDGLKEYRRLVLQMDVSPEAAYWVDLFDVDGGRVHDYSMHANPLGKDGTFQLEGVSPEAVPNVWTLAALDPKWKDGSFNQPGRAWGERLTSGGMVAKIPGVQDEVPDNPWWYAPPGNGYGFLYNVKSADTAAPWSATWRWNESGDRHGLRMTVLPEEKQQVITATGPILSGLDTMQWVVIRDGKPDAKSPIRTRYAAVLEGFQGEPVVQSVAAIREGGRVAGLTVSAGERQDTILDARKSPVSGLEGGLGIIRHTGGELSGLILTAGPRLEANGFAVVLETPVSKGRIVGVNDAAGTFRVSPPLPTASAGSTLVVRGAGYTHGSSYHVGSSTADGTVTPLRSDITLGSGKVTRTIDGGFESSAPLVFTTLHEQNTHYLDGKRVVSGGETAHILTVEAFKNVKTSGASLKPGGDFTIYDVQTGDSVTMDGTVSLTAGDDGVWTLRANGPARVRFPWQVERLVNGVWRAEARGSWAALSSADLVNGPVSFRRKR